MSGQRVPLEVAQSFAARLVARLGPACEQVDVVGSVRRRVDRVKDLELLAVPRMVPRSSFDLFGAEHAERAADPLLELLESMRAEGALVPRLDRNGHPRLGERYQALVYEGLALDLFIARFPASLGLLQLIRTGPAAFSKRAVTPRAHGGWLPYGFVVRDGAFWRGAERVDVATEFDAFAVLGLPYLNAWQRTETARPVVGKRVGEVVWVDFAGGGD